MNIPEASFALLEELKRMREDGVREIYLEEETLTQLEKKLEPLIPERPASPLNKPTQKKAVDLPTSRNNPVRQETTSVDTAESTPAIASQAPPKTITVEGAGVSGDNDAKFATPPSSYTARG